MRNSGMAGGFTLIELLAALLISALVLGGIYGVFLSQQRAFAAQERILEANQNLRAVMDLMTREIRLAGYRRAGSAFDGIAVAQASQIRILADLNQDGDTLDPQEDITYRYDGDSLQIWRNAGGDLLLAENILDFRLDYTLADGSITASPANLAEIRKVTVSITVRTAWADPATGQHRSLTSTSDVTPRNLAS